MLIHWYDDAVRFTGRWTNNRSGAQDRHSFIQLSPDYAATTAPGSKFELAFRGRMAVLHFDRGYDIEPYPHLYLSLDGGAYFEAQVDRYMRVMAPDEGDHVLEVIYKGGMEMLPRWHAPQAGVVAFMGAEAEAPGVLPEDGRRLIEFVGDSITEGVLIDADFAGTPVDTGNQWARPYEDDNLATYAALTAKKLNLRAMYQAYGAVGLTRSGCGGVPRAGLIYPYVMDGVEYTGEKPDIVLINHGANDRAAPPEEYLMRYGELLDTVRSRCPRAIIVCLSCFCGFCDRELGAFVEAYNRDHGTQVHFISSSGWVPEEPLHPLREGHEIIADHLTPLLRAIIG